MVVLKDYILYIDGEKVDFFALISGFIELTDKIIICTSSVSNNKETIKDNIFAVDRNGKIIWQVKTPYLYSLKKYVPQIYYNIKYVDNKLLAQNGGSIFDINVSTGEILDRWDDPSRDKA